MCLCKPDPHTIPLFMYFRIEGAKAFLNSHSLKITDPTRCNDPYECKFQLFQDGKQCRDIATLKLIDTQLRQYGIACFSTITESILMWAYYAESQKGICIEFLPSLDSIAFTNLQYISYKQRLPIINECCDQNKILEILTTKEKEWAHEEEVRLIREGLAGKLLTLNPQSITSVILGCNLQHFYDNDDDFRRKENLEQIIEILQRPEYSHVVLKQIVQEDEKYELKAKVIHSLVWQERDEIVVTSLSNQRISIKQLSASSSAICYATPMCKWEKVTLQLDYGFYYIESDSISGYLNFEVEEYYL